MDNLWTIFEKGQCMSIMRMRNGTEKSFICLALGIVTAGRKGINCIIDKSILNQFEIIRGGQHKFSLSCICEFGFQIRWKFCWIHLPLNIPVLIPDKIGMELTVSLSVYR